MDTIDILEEQVLQLIQQLDTVASDAFSGGQVNDEQYRSLAGQISSIQIMASNFVYRVKGKWTSGGMETR